MPLSVCGLFAGIGGFERAFQGIGARNVLFCEKDPSARAVLNARFPGIDVVDDVLELRRLPPQTDIVCAGFPCQNLSMAGDKSGIHGVKSGVVDRVFSLLKRKRAPLVLIENVPFMLHLDRGKAMSWLVHRFESLGYRWAYRTLDTMAHGLPQRRRRIYFIASTDIDPAAVVFSDSRLLDVTGEVTLQAPVGFYWTEGRSGSGLTQDGVPPIKAGSALGIRSTPAVLFRDSTVCVPSIEVCEQLQGFASGWTEPAEEVERRSRWRLIGNAVSVPVAEWVASRLIAKPVGRPPGVPFSHEGPWPSAAFGSTSGPLRFAGPYVGATVQRPTLNGVARTGWERISRRALHGFVLRAEGSTLRWPKGFLAALRHELRMIGTEHHSRIAK